MRENGLDWYWEEGRGGEEGRRGGGEEGRRGGGEEGRRGGGEEGRRGGGRLYQPLMIEKVADNF